MDVNEGKQQPRAGVLRATRVLTVLGSEAVAGLMLRWLTSSALEQGRQIVLDGRSGSETPSLSRLVVVSAACLVWVAFSVLVLSTIGTLLLAVNRGNAVRARGLGWLGGPLWCRRAVVCACGLGLTAPIAASPSLAVDAVPKNPCAPVTRTQTTRLPTLSGLPIPDLPDGSGLTRTAADARVVRRGESLWLIAGSELRPTASATAVGRRVDTLYILNRRAIGSDPDVIFPGTMLTQPGGSS